METTRIELEKDFEVENPIFLEGLAGIGHIGRNVVSYIAEHTEADQVGAIYSHHFPPFAMVKDDKTVDTIKNQIYQLSREDEQDIVLLEGNAQANTPQGHQEVAEKIMGLIDDLEVSQIITVGGYGTGDVVEDPEVFGVTTSTDTHDEYRDLGITFDHDVGQIVGVSGLLLGMGDDRGYSGVCVLGETPGFLLSDPKSTEEVLKIVEKLVNVDLDYSELDEKVEESQDVLKKVQNLKQSSSGPDQDQQGQGGKGNDLGYIG
ncbi:MAG: proteasome assembly chaperone family protein [Candidatus Nanosalina sp.]